MQSQHGAMASVLVLPVKGALACIRTGECRLLQTQHAHLVTAFDGAGSAASSLPLPDRAALPLLVPWDARAYWAGGSPTCLLARLKLPTHTCVSNPSRTTRKFRHYTPVLVC